MSKTRIISDIPTADANGNILHIQELAGPSSEDKPTVGLANGSLHMESDTGTLSVFDEDDGWNPAPGGGGSSLPAVTSDDNGKVLGVVNGAWAASEQGKKFIVTLTPTALDYSGTMDKTVAEINAAYEAGQEIVFRVMMSATEYMDVDCTERYKDEDYAYPSFNAYIVDNINNVIIFAFTAAGNDDTQQTYGTTVYSLTPAS